MSDATLACRMCTQPFSDVRLPKLVSGNITHIALEYHIHTSLLAARMCLCTLLTEKGGFVCSCWPIHTQLECMQRHICSVCIAEHQKSGAGGCVFPDCTAPATAIPAAELPTDQLILAKMQEAATSVSATFVLVCVL
jgi:hypothetical protein